MWTCEAWLVLDHVVVTITGPRDTRPDAIVLRGSGEGIVAASTGRGPANGMAPIELIPCGRAIAAQEVTYAFASPRLADLWLEQRPEHWSVSIDVEGGGQCQRQPLALRKAARDDLERFPPGVKRQLGRDPVTGALQAALAARAVQEAGGDSVRIEYAHEEAGVVFLAGWVPNFAALDIYVLTDDVAHAAAVSDAVPIERADITKFLRGQVGLATSTELHGFCVALPRLDTRKGVTIGVLRDGVFHILYHGRPELAAGDGRIFPMLLGAWQSARGVPLRHVTRLMAPFLQPGRAGGGHDVVQHSQFTAARPPLVSVVVPFYKEWRFLYSILTMVRASPEDWEWVVVCDDPGIRQVMRQMVLATPPAAGRRITLVAMQGNEGYGAANNAAVAEASGENILLMNSDIWMADFAAVGRGLEALARGDFDLLGFTLLFEDGTLQHDGMAFKRAGEFDSLYLCQHPGKGLPAPDLGGDIALRPADAVTGALMLVSKARFLGHGGFSSRYIGGDFEDADLCLALRAAGGRIGLVRSRTIFHLERQSIRKDARNNLGFARTMVNCERFNRRWAERLDNEVGSERGEGMPCRA